MAIRVAGVPALGVCPSGQRKRAVNPLAYAFVGSNPTAPIGSKSRELREVASGRKSLPDATLAFSGLTCRLAQRVRKRVEELIGWCKTTGRMGRTRFVERWKIALQMLSTAAA